MSTHRTSRPRRHSAPEVPLSGGGLSEQVEAFEKANKGLRPNFMAVGGYDGMRVIYEALKTTKGAGGGDESPEDDADEVLAAIGDGSTCIVDALGAVDGDRPDRAAPAAAGRHSRPSFHRAKARAGCRWP